MTPTLRAATPADRRECARICYEAFYAIASRHNFPPDFPSVEVAEGLLGWLLQNPKFYGVVAEADGRVLGSNFLDQRSPIAGVGPITIDPAVQNAGVGRALMEAVLERARESGHVGVRLLQSGYHARSLSLYVKLGFDAREQLANLQGPPIRREFPGYAVRPARPEDVEACAAVCTGVFRTRAAAAHAQRRAVPVVPGERAADGADADADVRWPLQRAAGRVLTFHPVLTLCGPLLKVGVIIRSKKLFGSGRLNS